MSQSSINFLTESNSSLSTSLLVDTMVTKETMEVEKDKKSPNNEKCKSKSDGDLISGTKNVVSTFNFFLRVSPKENVRTINT